MTELQKTLDERGEEYGDFRTQFSVAQRLKNATRLDDNIPPVYREVIDMICTKLSRAVTGNANNPDTWHDIAGYATLAENFAIKINGEKK